jgi:hypothetical protein
MAMKKLLVVGDSFMTRDPRYPGEHWSEMLPEYSVIMRSVSGSSNAIIAYEFVQGLKLNPDAVVMGFTMPDRIEFVIPPGRAPGTGYENTIWYSSSSSALTTDQQLAADLFRATTDDVMNTFKSMLIAKSMFLECERRKIPYAFNWNGLHGANKAGYPVPSILADIVTDFAARRCSNLNGHVFKMIPGFHNDDPECQKRMADEVRHILSTVDFS